MNTFLKRVTIAGMAAALGVGAVAIAGPAGADEFTTLNTSPTLTVPSFSFPGAQTTFEPGAGGSGGMYTYAVTLSDPDGLADVTGVSVCLSQTLLEDGVTAGEGDGTCAAIDPANTVQMNWDRATDVFSINAGGSAYWTLGTGADASTSPDLELASGILSFHFTISEAMREGSWGANAQAIDAAATTGNAALIQSLVSPYAAITTRGNEVFGTAAINAPVAVTAAPTLLSNGETTVSMTAGDFTSVAADAFTLIGGAPTTGPALGEMTYDCVTASAFDEATSTRITGTVTPFGVGTISGTVEGGVAVDNSCRLVQGGGRPAGTYGFAVVNTLAST